VLEPSDSEGRVKLGYPGKGLLPSLEPAMLDLLFGAMAEAVCVATRQGDIAYANAAAYALLGAPAGDAEALAGRLGSLRGPDGEAIAPEGEPLVRALHGEAAQGLWFLLPGEDGAESLQVALAYAPLRSEAQRTVGALLIIRDRTLEWRIERTRDDFLASVAHDLRSPLTAIRGTAQLALRHLQRQAIDTGALERALRTIDSASERLNRILATMLDTARLERGAMVLQCAPTDLNALIEEVIEFYRRESTRHQFAVQAPPRPVIGLWDAALLERALENLLSNAVKYSPNGGEVVVRCWEEGETVRLMVRDQGVGIAATALPRIFDRFYRAQNAGFGEIEGTGIGLFAVRGIVVAHGGSISARSVVGEGTEMLVVLPREAGECAP
jgi:signal transduction histidine kinase